MVPNCVYTFQMIYLRGIQVVEQKSNVGLEHMDKTESPWGMKLIIENTFFCA